MLHDLFLDSLPISMVLTIRKDTQSWSLYSSISSNIDHLWQILPQLEGRLPSGHKGIEGCRPLQECP